MTGKLISRALVALTLCAFAASAAQPSQVAQAVRQLSKEASASRRLAIVVSGDGSCPDSAAAVNACCPDANNTDVSEFTMSGFDQTLMNGCYEFTAAAVAPSTYVSVAGLLGANITLSAEAVQYIGGAGIDDVDAVVGMAAYDPDISVTTGGGTIDGPSWIFLYGSTTTVLFNTTTVANVFLCKVTAINPATDTIIPPKYPQSCQGIAYSASEDSASGTTSGSTEATVYINSEDIVGACGCGTGTGVTETFYSGAAAAGGALLAAVATAAALVAVQLAL